MNRFKMVLALALLGNYSAPAAAHHESTALDENAVHSRAVEDDDFIESFKVEGNGDFLLIPVTVDGQEHKFILDTGTSLSVFDTSLKSKLVPTGERIPLNGTKRFELFECRNATIGASKIPLGKFAICMDLEQFRDSGDDIRGILGIDALLPFVVQLDFDASRVRFFRTSKNAPGEMIKMGFDKRQRPTVVARLADEVEATFLIDTGARGLDNGAICGKTFTALAETDRLEDLGTDVYAVFAGKKTLRVGSVTNISVDEYEHSRQLFHESESEVNMLGLGYLSRYTVTLDFPRRSVFLARGKQYNRRFFYNELELYVRRNAGALVVVSCGANAEAGRVREGDRILEINGRDVRTLTLHSAQLLLMDVGDGIQLKMLNKDGKPLDGYLRRPRKRERF